MEESAAVGIAPPRYASPPLWPFSRPEISRGWLEDEYDSAVGFPATEKGVDVELERCDDDEALERSG